MSCDVIYKNIYRSKELSNFLVGLETKYNIEDAKEKYQKLVNFSTNIQVPYHQWFKYREGFASELIQELIKMSGAEKGEVIIDPFCGSGTTNVVAIAEGFPTLGLDVNPMSAFITQTKIDDYQERELLEALFLSQKVSDFSCKSIGKKYSDIRKYFCKKNFSDLVKIRLYIKQLPEGKSTNLLNVAFLSIVEECSDRKRDGNGLKTVPSKVKDVVALFQEKVQLIVSDIRQNQTSKNIDGYGVYSSAFNLKQEFDLFCKNKKAGSIIFSPPYANSFDYFESYKLELVFADYAKGLKGLNALRKNAIRSFVGAEQQMQCDKYVDIIADEIEKAIPKKEAETGRKDLRTRKVPNMLRGYFADMHEVIRQCSICLDKGKRAYIVVDQSAYLGKIVPTDLLLAFYAESEGFKVTNIINCRNARTSTQQLNKYPYLKNSLRESIVCLEKI